MTALPNTFMTPNSVVDRAMQYLTDAEFRVLIFTIRHILGWQDRFEDRKGRISLSTFEGGFKDKNDVVYGGCGLSRPVISKTLESLVELRFLEKLGEPTAKGQEWQLGLNVDWPTLEDRYAKKAEKAKQQTAKAAQASKDKRVASTLDVLPSGTLDVPVDQYVERTGDGTLDVPEGGTLDVHIQTHVSNPSTNTIKDSANAVEPDTVKGIADSHTPPEAPAATQPNTPPVPPSPNRGKSHPIVFDAWATSNFKYTDVNKIDPKSYSKINGFVRESIDAYQFQFNVEDDADVAQSILAFSIDWQKLQNGRPFTNADAMRQRYSAFIQSHWKRVAKPIVEQSDETDDTQDDSDVINDIVSSLASLGQMKGVKNVPAA